MHYLPTPEICATLSEEFAKSLKSSVIAPDDDLPAPDREKIMASLSIFKEEPFGISSVHKAGTGEDGRQLFKIACLTRDKTFEFLVDYSRGECKILSSDSRRNEYPVDL